MKEYKIELAAVDAWREQAETLQGDLDKLQSSLSRYEAREEKYRGEIEALDAEIEAYHQAMRKVRVFLRTVFVTRLFTRGSRQWSSMIRRYFLLLLFAIIVRLPLLSCLIVFFAFSFLIYSVNQQPITGAR